MTFSATGQYCLDHRAGSRPSITSWRDIIGRRGFARTTGSAATRFTGQLVFAVSRTRPGASVRGESTVRGGSRRQLEPFARARAAGAALRARLRRASQVRILIRSRGPSDWRFSCSEGDARWWEKEKRPIETWSVSLFRREKFLFTLFISFVNEGFLKLTKKHFFISTHEIHFEPQIRYVLSLFWKKKIRRFR